jgi:tripartite-type tricarboxylate transporter receptor subunit TctC
MTSQASRAAIAAAALIAFAAPAARAADAVADFYKGKQVHVIVGFAAGGGYDLYARLISRHMARFIPGNPTMVVQNMPGAGSVTAAQYLLQKAPRDGTTIGSISKDSPFDQVVNTQSANYDLGKLNWIGNANEDNDVMEVWAASGVRTVEDAKKREVIMGSTGQTGAGSLYPRLLNNIVGTKFKVIGGFPGSPQLYLAMERGEIDGRASDSLVSLKSTKPEYLRDKKVNVLMQMGFRRSPDLPDVPLMAELAKSPAERKVFELLSSNVRIGHPIVTTPEVPADRLAALIAAFDAAMKDPQFLAEAEQGKLDINPISSKALQEAVINTTQAPKEVVDLVLAASKDAQTFNCADVAKDKSLCSAK